MENSQGKPQFKVTNIPILFLKEGDLFVCYTPAFDLAVSGSTVEEAQASFATSLTMILEEMCNDRPRLEEMLQGYGWVKIEDHWSPPRLVGQTSTEVSIPVCI